MSSCLAIIDVQNGLLNYSSRHVVGRIQKLVKNEKFDHIVATRFINHDGSPHDKLIGWRKMMDKKSQTMPAGIAELAEKVFAKDVYSCFTPEFCNFVKKEKVDTLYFVGIDTDCCVLKSAADAFERGIKPIVVKKCCASHGGKMSHLAGLKVLSRLTGQGVIREGRENE
ncbi:MAG: cysteine hydrolase [Candidatus Nomurabacteria bacterium]|jgi:nicotinamidase-related amidase|nr:cysteine hydrolase [Candidatus Nomurabacteria bacterium]